ncbi:hypothetical protein [Nonomuraea dietziae]|uniref:hypothetical protein n=1 Tax=Nonomuraea dietziae TaxID=65515 RepID=UPI0031D3D10F
MFPRRPAQADTAPAPQDKSHVAAMAAKTDGKQAAVKQQQRVPAMPTASTVLAEAKKQIGVKENSSGGGTKFQQWYVNSSAPGRPSPVTAAAPVRTPTPRGARCSSPGSVR